MMTFTVEWSNLSHKFSNLVFFQVALDQNFCFVLLLSLIQCIPVNCMSRAVDIFKANVQKQKQIDEALILYLVFRKKIRYCCEKNNNLASFKAPMKAVKHV
jgi:hypothetical protein